MVDWIDLCLVLLPQGTDNGLRHLLVGAFDKEQSWTASDF